MRIQRVILGAILSIGYFGLGATAQTTEKVYLSGLGNDHTVEWQFYCTKGRNSGKWTTIPVPSCWELQGFGNYNYGNDHREKDAVIGDEEGRYKHKFFAPLSWKGKSVYIVFEGSMTDTRVEVNGRLAGPIHQGAFYAFRYDISRMLRYGTWNHLLVNVNKVSANESVNRAEREADYWIFGGIFRPVYLEIKPAQHIRRVAINAGADGKFTSEVFIEGNGNAARLICQIETVSGEKVGGSAETRFDSNAPYQTVSASFDDIKQWSPEFPNLYKAVFSLLDSQGRVIHKTEQRFGFRTVELREGDGFYVNGKKIRFKGVCYHDFWPSSGRTTSKDLVIRDVNLMKDMNINAIRLSHYPRCQYFYDVCDSLGMFVADELAGWQADYDSVVGAKLLQGMVTADENHPSIVMWNNGNEGGYNFDLDKYYGEWDLQQRPVNHPGSVFGNLDSQHYPDYHNLLEKLNRGSEIVFPDEFVHALYEGGGGAGLEDYWRLMERSPRSAGGFIWDYCDACVVRRDKGDSLDCAGNQDADGIVGPYREKTGSYYAIKKIWSPVQIEKIPVSSKWDKRLRVENHFYFTNLRQVKFSWELVGYPGPFDPKAGETVEGKGIIESPDVAPKGCGFLSLSLPAGWEDADALKIQAVDPHGREIDSWTIPIKRAAYRAGKIVPAAGDNTSHVSQFGENYMLKSGSLEVVIDKQSGYIRQIRKDGRAYSLTGPFLEGDSASLTGIGTTEDGRAVTATFSKAAYQVTYSVKDGWLQLAYAYIPKGRYPYFGIGFNYPREKVREIRWLGAGPDRVWKNRLEGAEFGLWHKVNYNDSDRVATSGYSWLWPRFGGYYAAVNWAVLSTAEGPITMVTSSSDLFLGLLKPDFGPDPKHAVATYPSGDISFLQAISAIGTKFKDAVAMGPSSQLNQFEYGYQLKGHAFAFKHTLWFYFGGKQ